MVVKYVMIIFNIVKNQQ